MDIAIVGPGRIGRTLALMWRQTGRSVALLGRQDEIPPAEVTVLAVPDRAIAEVASTIPSSRRLIHLSGATALGTLGDRPERGSLHPLMTFPGPEVAVPDLGGVYAGVDASTEATRQVIHSLAEAIGLVPFAAPADRALYHASAVVAGNLVTALFAEAGSLLAAAGVPADIARRALWPLAAASLRSCVDDPWGAITGPAARGDRATIARHREALRKVAGSDMQIAYHALTSVIEARCEARARPWPDAGDARNKDPASFVNAVDDDRSDA